MLAFHELGNCMCLIPATSPQALIFSTELVLQDAETRSQPTKNVQSQYERISEWLLTMGAEEASRRSGKVQLNRHRIA